MTRPYLFERLLSFAAMAAIGMVLTLAGGFAQAQDCPSQKYKRSSQTPIVKDMVNPHPDEYDFELPMPCGGKLFLRHVCIPARSFLDDFQFDMGCEECRRKDEGFMEAKRATAVAGAFTLEELPEAWRAKLVELGQRGDGLCPATDDKSSMALYYFIGKYEISNWQWQTVMADDCPGWDKAFTTEDPRPKTNISWFEAMEFTRRYTEWLLQNRRAALPSFPAGRYAFIRLPTEVEWEYAARGGHMITASEMNREEFFPLNNRHFSDFAVYTRAGAAKPPEKLSWVGTKCPNPLELFDTAGNAAEIMLDPFRYFKGSRPHGATGGFVIKGGSYSKSRAEIMPGRREEMPFFLEEGAFRSNDLGLRVVLSGIVTPQNRTKALRRQWTKIADRERLSKLDSGATTSAIDGVRGKILIAEIERRAAAAANDAEKEALLSEADYIKRLTAMVGGRQTHSLEALIWQALFSVESLHKYTVQLNQMEDELEMLKKMKAEPLPESEIESLKKNISGLTAQINHSGAAIDYLTQSYLENIRESQKFSQGAIDRQLDSLFQNQILEESLRSSLNSRLEIFRNHISRYATNPGDIRPEIIIQDVISEITP
jgi:formylglycine-generating enzyme required for sulfatase activity